MNFNDFLANVRILPLLVFVAMLAFSVRLVDVASGVAELSGSAHATATPEKPAEEPKAAPTAEHAAEEAAVDQAAPDEAPKVEGEAKPLAAGESPPPTAGAEDAMQWYDSGDSDTEFSTVRHELYDNLAKRREELDKRESDMMTREALLRAAEQEIDRKFNELSQLRGEIERLLQKQSDEEGARIGSLVKIYEGMKPADAARIFDTLDIDVLMSVMTKMSERKLSPILALMNAERARTITIMMAEQKQLPELPAAN